MFKHFLHFFLRRSQSLTHFSKSWEDIGYLFTHTPTITESDLLASYEN